MTVDGTTYRVPSPSSCWATQNPVTSWARIRCRRRSWTAFFMRVAIGYPSQDEEIDILDRFSPT